MKKLIQYLPLAAILLYACGGQQPAPAEGTSPVAYETQPGDSTRYGLACDGTTDSILVFLPYPADHLDTFDIITARQERRIMGRPHIGDELAVIVNPENSQEAIMVINMETLRGTWCYLVTPTLRNTAQMTERMKRQMMAKIPDSLKQRWLTPREYTLQMKSDFSAIAYGGSRQTTTDNMSPAQFPKVKHYTEWRIYNGRLILKADTITGFSKKGDVPTIDTADIQLLRKDSLVLRFKDHEQAYYRKGKH